MSERLKYVSPEYQAQLDRLAETLVNPERYGRTATAQMVLVFDSEMGSTSVAETLLDNPNIVVGEE